MHFHKTSNLTWGQAATERSSPAPPFSVLLCSSSLELVTTQENWIRPLISWLSAKNLFINLLVGQTSNPSSQ